MRGQKAASQWVCGFQWALVSIAAVTGTSREELLRLLNRVLHLGLGILCPTQAGETRFGPGRLILVDQIFGRRLIQLLGRLPKCHIDRFAVAGINRRAKLLDRRPQRRSLHPIMDPAFLAFSQGFLRAAGIGHLFKSLLKNGRT